MPRKKRSSKGRRSQQNSAVAIVVILLVIVWYAGYIPGAPRPETVLPKLKEAIPGLATFIPNLPQGSTPAAANQPAPSGNTASGLPEMPNKPQPQGSTFQGCPPEGDGGDVGSNILKNRIDEGNYVPVAFDAIAGLSWPQSVEKRDRDGWSAEDTAAIARYEGIPVSVEGYLAAATESGPESTNCHGSDSAMNDWHVSLVKNIGDDRSKAIVTETTPRIRANHNWTLEKLRTIIENQELVRISGWVFFDPEHPDHIGKYRITLWEIHPIMQIEVYRGGQWIPLDDIPE